MPYTSAPSYHVYLDDAKRSRQELHTLPHVARSTDSEVVELYLDVFRDSLSELEQLPLVHRILLKPRTRAVELQYTTLRSFLYVALGDAAAALRALEPVVEKLTGDRPQPPRWDEVHMAARLCDRRYQVGGDRADYEEAVFIFPASSNGDSHTARAGWPTQRTRGTSVQGRRAWRSGELPSKGSCYRSVRRD